MAHIEKLLKGKRCLVLDDEFLIALDIQQVLEAADAESVTCFGNANEVVTALRDGAFDLAVLDLQLGGAGNSISIAESLKERKTPFIFLTGMRSDDHRLKNFPNAPVVEKPYQAPALLDAIRRALGG